MILEKIYSIICDECNVPKGDLTLETNLRKDLDVDSLGAFQIFTNIEEEFEIEISKKTSDNINTIGELCEVIKNLQQGKE